MVKLLERVFEVPDLFQVRTPWNFSLSLQHDWTSLRSSCCMHGLKPAADSLSVTYACGTCYKPAFDLDFIAPSTCRTGNEAAFLEPIIAQLVPNVLAAMVLASSVEAEAAQLRSLWSQ